MYFTKAELDKVNKTLVELGMSNNPDIVLIDARMDNKQSASTLKISDW